MERDRQPVIIVTDDEESIRGLIKRLLERQGYVAHTACDAFQAQQLLRETPCDLMITDHLMPGKTGLDLIVETAHSHPDVAKILLTGVGNRALYREAINKGEIDSVLEKPFRTEELLSAVSQTLESHFRILDARSAYNRLHEQYHTLFDNTTDIIVSLDLNGSIVYVNPAFHRVLGYEPSDLVKLKAHQLLHASFQEEYPELINLVRHGKLLESFESVMLAKDGSLISVEGNAAGQYQDTALIAVTFILRDITERKRSEQAIQARLEQETMIARIAKMLAGTDSPVSVYPAILETIGRSAGVDCAAMYSIDRPGSCFALVGEWMPAQEHRQSRLDPHIPFLTIPWMYDRLKAGHTVCIDTRHKITEPDRTYLMEHLVHVALFLPILIGDETMGMLGFMLSSDRKRWEETEISLLRAGADILANAWRRQLEIDARKEKEHEAEQSRLMVIRADRLAALGTMTAGIIHEITQPLNAINVSAQTILYGFEKGWNIDSDQAKRSLDLIVDQIKRITNIITNMRAFARDGSPSAREMGSLNIQVGLVLSMLGEQLNAHNIDVELELNDIPDLSMNTQHILQVILNLVTNARQALDSIEREDKKIFIRSFIEGNSAVLEVTDNGPGIPDSIRERIFDPFFTTKEVGQGTGLGLSISTGFIQDHHGIIDCHTNDLGGTTFIVRLPAHSENGEHCGEHTAG